MQFLGTFQNKLGSSSNFNMVSKVDVSPNFNNLSYFYCPPDSEEKHNYKGYSWHRLTMLSFLLPFTQSGLVTLD